MQMSRLLVAAKTAIILARADIPESDRYDLFAESFRRDRYAYVFAESDVKSAYLLWRLNTLRAKDDRTRALQATLYIFSNRRRQLILAALVLGVLALLFPPFQLNTTNQSLHLGFGFVFSSQLGQINSTFLLVELAAIGLGYWLADKFLVYTHASATNDLSQK